MEELKQVVGIVGGLGGLVLIVKAWIELRAIPSTLERSQYEFAYSLAERYGDPSLASYAEELGYKTLVKDGNLSMPQRKALLTIRNRVKTIPLYMKARRFLVVQQRGPILRWKHRQHKYSWYRKSVMRVMFFLYFIFGLTGLPALLGPYPKTEFPTLDELLGMPSQVSLSLIFLAAYCLYHALTLSTAEDLVAAAEAMGPHPE